MLLRKSGSLDSTIRSSEITPEDVFHQHNQARRRFLAGAATLGAGALAALGARFLDAHGAELAPVPAALANVATVDLSALDARARAVDLGDYES